MVVCLCCLGRVEAQDAAPKPDVLVVNKGIGGSSTRDALARFERDVIEVKPDHLILYFGINDAGNSKKLVPLDEYVRNMQTMIDRARAAGVETVVLVTLNPVVIDYWALRHPTHPNKTQAHFDTYDAAVRKLAEKNGLPIADLRALINQHGGATQARSCLIRNEKNSRMKDGVHLTAEGYRLMAELFVPIFKDRIKPGQTVVCFGDSITYGAGMKGAGTACGATYPAWLWLHLNRMVGATDRSTPRPPPPDPDPENLIPNGGAEASADRVHADEWRIWNADGKYAGEMKFMQNAPGAHGGKNYLRITNPDERTPAHIAVTCKRRRIAGRYRLSFWARGAGRIRPLIYSNTRKANLPTFAEDNTWHTLGADWKEYSLAWEPADGVIRVSIAFLITGQVDLDDVSLHPNKDAGVKPPLPLKGEEHVLSNRHMTLRLYPPEQGGGVRGIRNAEGYEFINGACDGALWRIDMRRIPDPNTKRNPLAPLSFDPEQNDTGQGSDDGAARDSLTIRSTTPCAEAKGSKDGDRLVLSWTGIDVGEERGALDVQVTISLAKDDPFARFRTEFRNRSTKYTVFYVFSPMVNAVYPPDGKPELDWLASPVFTGRLMRNPIRNGILGQPARMQPNRSGHSMQFDAYYHKDHGLYLGCFDGEQNAKRYLLSGDPDKGLGWAMVHVPNNMMQIPQNWATPYDTVVRCYRGDWYDACRIYREWALKQSWTAQGPLHERASTPTWFKEIVEWFLWPVQKRPLANLYEPKLLERLRGLSLGLCGHNWGQENGPHGCKLTPHRFPLGQLTLDHIRRAKEHDFRLDGYIQGICWDMEAPSFKSENGFDHTVRNFYGQRVIWKLGRGKEKHIAAIAYPGEVWTRVLGDTIQKMAEAGFDGAYLDSFNHAGMYLNFNPRYTKNLGGGNTYIKDNQKLFRAIQARARKVNPEFCFTAESFWEGNMACLDGLLVCNTTNQPLKKGEIFTVPMAHAVYHDRGVFFSSWTGRGDVEERNALGFTAKMGEQFVYGVKGGRNQPNFLLVFKNHEIALDVSERIYRAYAAAKKFLVYGEMLRPPEAIKPPPEIDVRWYRGWSKSYYDIALPAIRHSLWRAPDGSLGLVLHNIDAMAHTITLRLSDPAYGLADANALRVTSVYPPEAKDVQCSRGAKGTFDLSICVSAKSPRVLMITPE